VRTPFCKTYLLKIFQIGLKTFEFKTHNANKARGRARYVMCGIRHSYCGTQAIYVYDLERPKTPDRRADIPRMKVLPLFFRSVLCTCTFRAAVTCLGERSRAPVGGSEP
jgi:hypothetical protein